MKKDILNKLFVVSILIIGIVLFITPDVTAQCPMCKMAAESNLKNGGTDGAGLNKGILYMLMTPYLLVGTLAYLWWRNQKQEVED